MTRAEFAARLKNACAAVTAAEAELTEIDSKFGDADHGLTMAKIAGAISEAVDAAEGGIQSMLDDAAMAVMTLNGGSAVPLWNTWLDGLPIQETARTSCSMPRPRPPPRGRRLRSSMSPNSAGPRVTGPRPSAPRTRAPCPCPGSSRGWPGNNLLFHPQERDWQCTT